MSGPDLVVTAMWGSAAIAFAYALAYAWLRRRHSSAGLVVRWARRSKRNQGMASWLAHLLFTSRWAMLRKARAVRPSLRDVSRWRLLRTPVTEHAVALCKVGRRWTYAPLEDVTLRVGGPRVGKSVSLVPTAVDAPGAILVTSTRTDLLDSVGPTRAKARGTDAIVFNPSGVGGIPSSVKFSPLHGCRKPAVAYGRAEDMIGGRVGGGDGKSGDAERWDMQARRILSILLHAAALSDQGMFTVQRWIATPAEDRHSRAVLRALETSPAAGAMEADFMQFLTTNDRTRSSITNSIAPALGWLTSDTAVAATEAGGEPFDVEHFIATNGQLYLLGAQDGLVAPLIGAFTGYVARECRRLARLRRSGRLDPPVSGILDEATLVPVDLPSWTADMGGSGFVLHIAVQGRSQLERTWGREGAATILNNSGTVLVFGGVRDPDDLDAWSKLSGHRRDDEGQRVPVLSPAEVSQLPAWRVLAISRGIPASIGRVPKSWRRRDIRRAQRAYATPLVMETRYATLPDPEGIESA